jgi:hypothetical protein
MNITDVECLILDQFPFARIYNDEGIVGIGECFRRQPKLVKFLIDSPLYVVIRGI